MTWTRKLSPLVLAGAVAACGGNDPGPRPNPAPPIPSFAWPSPAYRDVQAVFDASCVGCHGGAAPQAGMSLAAPGSWGELVEVSSTTGPPGSRRVVPFDAAASVLYQRVTSPDPLVRMPLGLPALSQAQIDAIRSWIETGGARQDVRITLREMAPHLGQLVVARLQSGSGELRVRAVLDPLTDASFELLLPRAMPTGSHVLDFFADLSGDRSYDPPPPAAAPNDHAWRVSVPGTGLVDFTHNTSFIDIGAAAPVEPGLDFVFQATGFTPHVGQLFGLAVYKLSARGVATDRQLVGLYRLAQVPAASFSIAIPGVIQANEDYSVDFFADLSGDEAYGPPPADHAWRVDASSDLTGLTVTFGHDTAFTDISKDP